MDLHISVIPENGVEDDYVGVMDIYGKRFRGYLLGKSAIGDKGFALIYDEGIAIVDGVIMVEDSAIQTQSRSPGGID
jgi:hypothetical protein